MRRQLGERTGVGINIRELELRFVQRLNYLQNIQHPGVLFQPAAALLGSNTHIFFPRREGAAKMG